MKTKTCPKCGETKDVGEFVKDKSKKDGLAGNCKSCKKAYREANKEKIAERQRAYQEANKEKLAEQRKAYREANKKKIALKDKAYYQGNKEKIAEKRKAYYEANIEEINKQKKAYYEENKEKISEKSKAYYEENKDKKKAYYEANKDKINKQKKAYQKANKDKINTRRRAYRKYKYNNDPLFKLKAIYRYSVKKAFASIGKKKNCSSIKVLGLNNYKEYADYLSNQFYDHPISGEKMTFDNHGSGEDCWQIDHIIPLLTAETEEDVIRLSHYTNLQPLWEVDHLKKTASDFKQYKNS